MAILECSVERNRQNKQLNVEHTAYFPLSAYYNDMDHFAGQQIPWHWHEELEMIYVAEGKVLVHAGKEEMILDEGDAIWINSNVLHHVEKAVDAPCVCYSFVTHSTALSGDVQSVFAKRYLDPLCHAHDLSCQRLDVEAAGYIVEAYQACQKEAYGYEIEVRELLMKVCLRVLKHHDIHNEGKKKEGKEVTRLKQMMQYLQEHYMEQITIAQLALLIHSSEREVLRCFRSHLKESPIQVLMQYRMMKACELLGTSEASVTEIAAMCGFHDSSYFAKMFKRMLHMSPSQYRKIMK